MQKIFFIALVVIGLFTGIFIAQIIITFSDLKDIKSLENYSTYSVPTKVYDVNNKLITEFFLQKREIVSYKDLPDSLIKALIATEDNDFYKRHGFDPVRLLKGVIIDLITGKRVRGGSTITQQLAKNLFTTSERSIFRKLKELWYAFQIEKKYSKEEILELYFNEVNFGHGCYGVQAAAHYYFDKNVNELDLGEASLLAGLGQLPNAYSPILYPYRAQKRHQIVLNSMVKSGFITKETANEAFENFWENYSSVIKAKGIIVQRNENNYAPYFTEYVRSMLIKKYGEDKLYNGGLQIYTTLDIEKQKIADVEVSKGVSNEQANYDRDTKVSSQRYKEAYQDIIDLISLTFGIDNMKIGSEKVRSKLENIVNNYEDVLYLTSFIYGMDSVNRKIKSRFILSQLVEKKQDQIEGALISINPKNGYIEAMVGGSGFSYANQYNRAIQSKRQMGSLFKAIYYAIALDKKIITPATVYDDKPMVYLQSAGNLWSPRNYEGTFMGKIRIRQALQHSVNIVAIQVWDLMLKTLGFNNIVSIMSDYFGISKEEGRKRIEPQLAYALGVGTFSPYEVAQAFSIYANDGVSIAPIAILKVKDRYGRVMDDFEMGKDMDKSSKTVIMSPGAAFLMQSIMSDVLYKGTGSGAASEADFNLKAGGKTGTTSNWKDAWFAGFTKNLATVVWFGFDDAKKSLGRNRVGGVVAAPVWMRYMKQSLKNEPDVPFSKPDDVVEIPICATSGLLPTEYCPHIINEFFLKNTSPSRACDVHTASGISTEEDKQIDILTNSVKLDELEMNIEPETKKTNSKEEPEKGGKQMDNFNIKSGIE